MNQNPWQNLSDLYLKGLNARSAEHYAETSTGKNLRWRFRYVISAKLCVWIACASTLMMTPANCPKLARK